MYTVHGSRRGVLYVYDGKMMGGNSAFAFIGTYQDANGDVAVDISTLRHNEDPKFQPLLKTDQITLALRGKQRGDQYFFEGGTPQLPGVAFNSVMTPISEEAAPLAISVEKGGIGNGLYSIHIRMLDGIDGGNTGVMVLHDGKIRGGDAFFDYIGAYTSANGRWKGELVNHEHTPNQGERPVFGGYEVGIGFSGTYTDEGAVGVAGEKQDHLGQFLWRHPFAKIRFRHVGAIGGGVDDRRQYGVDGDFAFPFGGERLGEAMHAGLGRGVGAHAGAGLQRSHRADIDDPG